MPDVKQQGNTAYDRPEDVPPDWVWSKIKDEAMPRFVWSALTDPTVQAVQPSWPSSSERVNQALSGFKGVVTRLFRQLLLQRGLSASLTSQLAPALVDNALKPLFHVLQTAEGEAFCKAWDALELLRVKFYEESQKTSSEQWRLFKDFTKSVHESKI